MQCNPDLTPREVVRRQLDALADVHTPHENAGIGSAFGLVSPPIRRLIGSLGRFEAILHTRTYAPLLDHLFASFGELRVEGDEAAQPVTITTPTGRDLVYLFKLSRQRLGLSSGCWLVDAVIPLPVSERVERRAPADHPEQPTFIQ